MPTATDEVKAKRAAKERDRRAKKKKAEAEAATATEGGNGQPRAGRVPKDPEATAIVAKAKEIAPQIKSPYQPFEARSLMNILGNQDPIAFLGLSPEATQGRNRRDVVNAWACGELAKDDPAAKELRMRTREISRDERGRNLWGRKCAALLLAIDAA